MRVIAVVALVVTLLSWVAPDVRADDACAGMDAYEQQLLDAGRDYGQWLIDVRFAERDATTFSAPEWIELAEHAEASQQALKAITPPAGVADWHEAKIDGSGFQSTIGRSAASTGIVATALVLQEQSANIDAKDTKAKDAAIKACPEFAEVYAKWDALDQTAATPVASPTP